MNLSLDDRLAIDDLYSLYNVTVDSGADEAWVQTFTQDGVFHASREVGGHDELRAFRRERVQMAPAQEHYGGQHWNSNLIVFLRTPDEAEAICYLMRTGRSKADDAPMLLTVARYHDKLRRTRRGWRFVSRRVLGPDELPEHLFAGLAPSGSGVQ